MALLGAVVLAVVAATGVVYYSGGEPRLDSLPRLGAGDGARRTVSAPLDGRADAGFELLAAVTTVRVRIGDLGDELYRISTPEGSGLEPRPVLRDDTVQLQLSGAGAGEVEVLLSARVSWAVRFAGYARERLVDLRGGRVTAIDMLGGAGRVRVSLPQPSGTVPVTITGGLEELTLEAPDGGPVRVRVAGGARSVTAGARTLRDLKPGSTLTPKDWATPNRYDVDAASAITVLTVDAT